MKCILIVIQVALNLIKVEKAKHECFNFVLISFPPAHIQLKPTKQLLYNQA